jgi:hypothetical protein
LQLRSDCVGQEYLVCCLHCVRWIIYLRHKISSVSGSGNMLL